MASSDWSHVVTGSRRTVVGLLAVWVVGVIALYVIGRRQDDPTTLKAALRLPPDVLRLLRRLAADHPATRRSRQLMLLIGYLMFTIDYPTSPPRGIRRRRDRGGPCPALGHQRSRPGRLGEPLVRQPGRAAGHQAARRHPRLNPRV